MEPPHPASRLTEAQILEIWQRAANGESTTSLAGCFNASQTTIKRIVRGESWANLTGGRARATHPKPRRLTAQQVVDARRAVRNGALFTEVAENLGVGESTVRYAVRGGWSEVDAIEPPYTEEIGSGRPGLSGTRGWAR